MMRPGFHWSNMCFLRSKRNLEPYVELITSAKRGYCSEANRETGTVANRAMRIGTHAKP